MAFKKGKSGNPGGRKLEKPWREAIQRAVKRRLGDSEGQALEKVADALVTSAIGGDISAIKEIGDRLDGKAHQSVDLDAAVSGELTLRWMTEK